MNIKELAGKLKRAKEFNFNRSLNPLRRGKRFNLIATLLIALAIPLTVFLASQIQRLRTKAAPGNAALSIVPATQTNSVGATSTMDVFLNPNGENVGGIELVMNYDPAVINVTNIAPGAFFTNPQATIGNPVEATKTIQNGQIHYIIGFPLSSHYGSTTAAVAATISYTATASGTSNLTFILVDGTTCVNGTLPNCKTAISDVNGNNVIDYANVIGGTVNVSSGARLYFSAPRPANPQRPSQTFQIDILVDTGGQNIDGVDARITFSPSVLRVANLVQGTATNLPSYPVLTYDNTAGTVNVSANLGTGTNPTPANGSNLNIGTITFNPLVVSAGTNVSYNFTAGSRNDSNIVLSGTSQTTDPVDILSSVTNATIVIQQATATPTPTTAPTATPLPTSTPTPTSVPPTATPTTNPTANLALNKPVSASSSIENWGWYMATATDGQRSSSGNSMGWSSNNNTGTDHTEWVIADLGFSSSIGRVDLYPRNDSSNTGYGFPIDFTIQLSQDNVNWTTVVTRTNYALPGNAVQSFTFTQQSARYVKIQGTKLRSNPNDTNLYRMQLAEIEVYNQQIASSPTPMPTSQPTATPTIRPTNTPTPQPTSTTTPPTPTPTPTQLAETIKLAFQGITRTGAGLAKQVTVSYRTPTTTAVTPFTVNFGANGLGTINLNSGNYLFLFKTPGYLAKRFGSTTSPIQVTTSTTLDFSASPLAGGDLNGDGIVNEVDYSVRFLPNFLTNDPTSDLDGSGQVNNLDFTVIRRNWGLVDDTL